MQNELMDPAKKAANIELSKSLRSADCSISINQPRAVVKSAAEVEAERERLKKLEKERNTPQPLGPGLGCVR